MGLLLTSDQALDLVGRNVVSRNRWYAWLKNGLVPSVKDGRRYFISMAVIERLVAQIAEGRWPDHNRKAVTPGITKAT